MAIEFTLSVTDEKKVKLTYVPGAVLFEYVHDQKPSDVQYEIGEEKVESGREYFTCFRTNDKKTSSKKHIFNGLRTST